MAAAEYGMECAFELPHVELTAEEKKKGMTRANSLTVSPTSVISEVLFLVNSICRKSK